MGDSRSVTSPLTLLRNTEATDLARTIGALRLGIVADMEDLPWNA